MLAPLHGRGEALMCSRFLTFLVSIFLLGSLAGCGPPMVLDPETTIPPEWPTTLFIEYPNYVGTEPTEFDGTYYGNVMVDVEGMCTAQSVLTTNTMITFVVSRGIITRIDHSYMGFNPSGYVNKRGVYIARASGTKSAMITTSGRITGDRVGGYRLDGEWVEWGFGCEGRFELILQTGGQNYCIDPISGKPYASGLQCNGIDKLLTKAEYEDLTASPTSKAEKVSPSMPITAAIGKRLEELKGLLDRGLLTPDEAASKRKEILKGL